MATQIKAAGMCALLVVASGGIGYSLGMHAGASQPRLTATPRIIAKCEKDVSVAMSLAYEKPFKEKAARFYAISVHECDQYGLVRPRYMATIMEGQLAPYIKAYAANPNVWRKF
ncbi:hypothetical protein [Ferirhizobium litorale]|uniref:Uncharacterized protein n=1 Tax=Ferirhizobium litorale TaxID=2927786 RepID=A0AAE3QCT1_9HYPH|nr:hypothetical protein [Fererhizobium litorale]MDI7923407.1 hypothetical protein [Fererhizobium litorale]